MAVTSVCLGKRRGFILHSFILTSISIYFLCHFVAHWLATVPVFHDILIRDFPPLTLASSFLWILQTAWTLSHFFMTCYCSHHTAMKMSSCSIPSISSVVWGVGGIIYFKFCLGINQVKDFPLISWQEMSSGVLCLHVLWLVCSCWPTAGGGAAAVASLLDQVMGLVLQTSKSEPHPWQGLGHHIWFRAILVLGPIKVI